MRIINGYYLIEPGDSLDEIKYLMNIGCKVLGCFKIGKLILPDLFLLTYSKFGASIQELKFEKHSKNSFDYSYYYVKW
jgi:hypothetical protein